MRIKPIYVLHGDDAFLRDAHRRRIISEVIGDADPQVSITSFDATAELPDVLDELRAIPFLSPRRVVIVRDADGFVSAHREVLEKYLKSPADHSALVLIVSSWRPSARLGKLAANIGEVLDCSAGDEVDLPRRLVEAAAKRGKKLDASVARLLIQCAGNDLAALDQEIEKLSLYVGQRKSIGQDDVAAVAAATAGPVAFALTNAITAADVPGAIGALAKILSTRGQEFAALGSIAWHLRRAMAAQQLIRSGTPATRAVPQMPLPHRNAFLAMLKRRSLEALRKDFGRLIRTDLAMKSGADPLGALQMLLVQLCSRT